MVSTKREGKKKISTDYLLNKKKNGRCDQGKGRIVVPHVNKEVE